MKKVLASVLAAAMSLSLASVAFAAELTPNAPGISGDADYNIGWDGTGALAKADYLINEPNKTEYKFGANDRMYTYGEDHVKEKEITFVLPYDDSVRADVSEGAVSVSLKKGAKSKTGGFVDGKGKDYGYTVYNLTIKAKAGVRDFKLEDFTIELDVDSDVLDKNLTYYIKGKVAYSDYQEVASDDRLSVKKSDGTENHETGSIFNFDEVIDEETRIRVNDYIDVYFKGNYGTDKENMRVVTDEISEVEKYFGDQDLDYYDFVGTPKFATKVKVIIDGDPNAFLYEYDKKTGDIKKVDAKYESDGWSFTTKNLGTYILAEEEYDEGNVEKETVTSEPVNEPTSTPDEKENPGTGANDMVGVAAALAVVSLVAAGAVAFKKASK